MSQLTDLSFKTSEGAKESHWSDPSGSSQTSEGAKESHWSDPSGTSQTVTRLAEEGESTVLQLTTASDLNCDKMLPIEIWKNMTLTERKNYHRQKRLAKPHSTQSFTFHDVRKRGWDTYPTPFPNNTVKKAKLDCSGKEVNIKVAVVHQDYPYRAIGERRLQGIMSRLLKEIRKPNQGTVKFNGFSLRKGTLVVNCVDELTKEWFVHSIAKLSPWEGAFLKTCHPNELERFRKIGTFLPNPVEGIDECLTNIECQNRGLQTGRWKILSCKDFSHGMYLVASIPESVVKKLESIDYKIFHGFHHVPVKLFPTKDKAPDSERVEGDSGSEDEAVPVPDDSGFGSKSGQSVPDTVKLEPKQQCTEPRSERDHEKDHRDTGSPTSMPKPWGENEKTLPHPIGNPPPS